MKNSFILLIFVIIFTITNVQAQNIAGRVTDKNNNPIELAVVLIHTTDSVYVNSVYTDSLGVFTIKADIQSFLLTVQHLAYETIQSKHDSPIVGVIQLIEKNQIMGEVSINAEVPLVRMIDGKMTYNMSMLLKNKMTVSAFDAIIELPGVQQRNGKIELAGASSVTVVINGKPTNMGESQLETLLKNMPKERIQVAEIMYSAPPQYHVRGAVINLVLKGGGMEMPKLQGQVNASYNQGNYANYQGSTMLVYNTPNTTTDFMYSFAFNHNLTGEDILSHHLFKGNIHDIEQLDRGYSKTPIHTIRLGNDWTFNGKNKIAFAYTAMIQQWVDSFTSSKGTYSDSENRRTADNPTQMHNLSLGYTSTFGLSTGADFTYYTNNTTQHYQEKIQGKEDAFNAKAIQDIFRLKFYIDQNHQLGRGWGINYGTRFSFSSDKSSQIYQSLGTRDWTSSNSNNILNEYVYDIYAGFTKVFSDKLSLNAAVSGEYYKHGEIDYWSAFPMLELTYIANTNNILKLSISSDKAYPSYWEMQDATSYLSGYTEIQGNKSLTPSKNYSVQLNSIIKNKYIFTLYANYNVHNFSQIPYQSPERLVLIFKTLNDDYSSKIGLNIVLPFSIGSFIDSRLTLNGYYDKTKSLHYHDISYDKDNFAFYANLDNTFNISSKPNIKANLSASYITPNIQGPMMISSMYTLNAGVKWTSDNNKIELSLKADDIFNSWSPRDLTLQYKTQNLIMYMIPDTRRISLSIIYKFGDFKPKAYKQIDSTRFGK